MSEQLTLSVLLDDDASFQNFYPATNVAALHCLKQMAHGRGEHYAFIWGLPASGCSHLLQAACRHMHELRLPAMYIDLTTLHSPDVFEGLESLQLVCLDNIDAIVGNVLLEEAVFHFYNRIQESGHRLMIAGRQAPSHLGVRLADLQSRLSHGVVFQIHQLDDEKKLEALQFRAHLKGLEMPEQVAQFLLRHCQRDMNNLAAVLNQLDQASLAAQRKLTVPFVKSVLDK